MDGTPRRRSTGAGSRGQHARRRWWRPTGRSRPTSTDESPTDVGEAAVAADGLGAASADREDAVEPDGGGAASAIPLPILLQADESGRLALNLRTMPTPSDGSGAPSAVAAVGGEVADATDLQRVQDGMRTPCPCPLGRADGSDDDTATMTVSSYQPGDSIWEKSEGSEDGSDANDVRAAVAADDAQPKETHRTSRSKRQPRNIAPELEPLHTKWAERNDADHVGNIGWLFGNWGSRAQNQKMREHIDEVLKKQPAMVIGMAECQLETEQVLQREPAAVAANATSGARRRFKDRPEFSYLTLRGEEEKSVLIAVRDQAGCAIQMLNCEIYDAGKTKSKKSKNNKPHREIKALHVLDTCLCFFGFWIGV